MAENKAQNEAFLKQMERQRLNRLSNRIIDLRGKVPGECQAYEFGGKKHYLDDRGYLLAKQLLDRFNGRYTVGVYETVLKAIKTLSQNAPTTAANTADEEKPILLCDKSSIQFMPFDSQVQRKEPRLNFATQVQIVIDDVLYHGATIDITTSAIRVALKRAFTLDDGDKIIVNFVEFAEQSGISNFNKVAYKVLKTTHDELRTQLILLRKRHDDDVVTQWLDKWSQKHNTPEYLDLDNELFNLANRFYLRLYSETLNKPLLWLNKDGQLNKLHLSITAEHHLQALRNSNGDLDFSTLPIAKLIKEPGDYLLAIDGQDGNRHCYLAPRDDMQQVKDLLVWHSQHPNSFVLLFNQSMFTANLEDVENELEALKLYDDEYAAKFKQSLVNQHSLVSISDITQCCQQLNIDSEPVSLTAHKDSFAIDMSLPEQFRSHVERKKQRYHIRTEIKFQIGKQKFEAKTTNASENGLAVSLPGNINVAVDARINIDFVRWQGLTKKVKLKGLPFSVRSVRFWQGQTLISMERETRACAGSINTFFSDVIELNKEKLVEENEHTRIALESAMYSTMLTPRLQTTPLYMTMDKDSVRILQAVSSTTLNKAMARRQLWLSLQHQVRAISEQLKPIVDKPNKALHFGLYSYLDSKQQWQIQTEYDFNNETEKSIFINQALMAPEHYFYLCALTPVKSTLVTQQEDLYQQLVELRSHSQHKVKQIREVLHNLFAVGELTDITDIIDSVYH